MGACWEAISVNNRRMLNNEILKKKNFYFHIKKSLRNISREKGFGISNIVYIYEIENIVTDHNKKKHPIHT